VSRPPSTAGRFAFGVLAVVGTVLALALGAVDGPARRTSGSSRPASPAAEPRPAALGVAPAGVEAAAAGASGVVGQAPAVGVVRAPAVAAAGGSTPVQVDPELLDPGLRREHDRLLRERPLFQHLPYRDTEIGVDFDRVVAGGRLELLVTYLGSRARAVGDVRRLLARYGDPGTAYVERYEKVF